MVSLGCSMILALVSASPSRGQNGFATYGGSVTGGAAGPTVTVTTLAEFNTYATAAGPYVIQVSGTINLGSSNVRFGSNKTIRGVGSNSGFIGNLKGVGETNVIIQNLNFTNPNKVGDGDGISLEGCTRIWIDHCSFVDCGDGSLDIKRGSDLITVSWCKFSYTFNSGHNFVNLIGHSDSNGSQDRGKLRITFHHNWWSTGCVERMPRVRFGQIHSYNNYFNAPGNNYCMRASIESQILSERNYFENINNPYEYFAPNGRIRTVGDVHVNCTNVTTFNDSVFTPPYSYSMDTASNVKSVVMAGAGTGSSGGGTPPPSGVPAAPSNLAATAASTSQINLSWNDNSSNETGFRIERAVGGGTFSQIATVGANVRTFSNTGLSAGTTYSYRVRAYNSSGNSSYTNTASATTGSSGGGSGTSVTFVSIAAEDGRILESSETSNQGGTVDASGSSSSTLRVGDDSGNRQYKTFLSFDTSSIPDNATITSAVVRLRRGGSAGTNPFTTHGPCYVDIKSGSGFSNSVTLQAGDFQAAADATQVATMSNPSANGDWSSGPLNATGRSLINKTGKTQLRIYFQLDDNNNGTNDYIGFHSGNDGTAGNRPVLEVTYQ
jgi:pectate lyase